MSLGPRPHVLSLLFASAVIVACAQGSGGDGSGVDVDLTSPGDGGAAPAPAPDAAATACSPATCPARPHATAGCDSGGACVLAGCEAGFADCNHDPSDGCDTDVRTDTSNCGACGNACPIPPNATATCAAGACGLACWDGFARVGTKCATFGGSFVIDDAGCTACATPNALGGTCGCPAGFGTMSTARILDDCSGIHGGLLTFCASSAKVGSDWNGAYEVDDAADCTAGCRMPNPRTGACSCPSGSQPIVLRTLVDTSCGNIIGSSLVLCHAAAAPITTFGGAYQLDDAVAGSLGCRTPNPRTGACTCPAGTSVKLHRVVVDGPIGSRIGICMP